MPPRPKPQTPSKPRVPGGTAPRTSAARPRGTPVPAGWRPILQRLGIADNVPVTTADLAAMLDEAGGLAEGESLTGQSFLRIAGQRPASYWQKWIAARAEGDAPEAAVADASKPAAAAAKPKPAAKEGDAKPQPSKGRRGAMTPAEVRELLATQYGMDRGELAKVKDSQLGKLLVRVRSESEKPAAAGKPRQGSGRKPPQKPAAVKGDAGKPKKTEAAAGVRRGKPQGVVDTADEGLISDVEDAPSGGIDDLGEMSSEQLYRLARERQIAEAISPQAQARIDITGKGGVNLDPAALGDVTPFPETVSSPAASQPTPQTSAATGQQPMPKAPPEVAEPPKREPGFFIGPGLWNTPRKEDLPDTKQDGWLKALARRPHVWGTTAATVGGIGGVVAMRSGGGGSNVSAEERQRILLRAIQARKRMHDYFGPPGTSANVPIPADNTGGPEETIRQMQRGQ